MGGDVEPADPGEIEERRQVIARRAFQANASTWAIVNMFLVFIWAVTGHGYFWPVWTIGPWGFVLALQARATYGGNH